MPDVSTLALNNGVELPALGFGGCSRRPPRRPVPPSMRRCRLVTAILTLLRLTAMSGRSLRRCAALAWAVRMCFGNQDLD